MAKVLICSKDSTTLSQIAASLAIFKTEDFILASLLENFLEQDTIQDLKLALVDGRHSENETMEWTQTIKMSYPDCKIIVLYTLDFPLQFEKIKKNGADRLLHYFFDQEFLLDTILQLVDLDFGDHPPLQTLQSIDESDLSSEIELNFDLYVHLPHNHRTIKLRKKGSLVEKETAQKVKNAGQSFYFSKTQASQFLDFARTVQTYKNVESAFSPTEKNLKFKIKFFEFVSEFMDNQKTDFEAGRKIFALAQEMVQDYGLLTLKNSHQWKPFLAWHCGLPRTPYQEALNLALFSSWLTQVDGQDEPTMLSVSLCGLFHNVGLSKLNAFDVLEKKDQLSEAQKSIYRNYPLSSIEMIKLKKVPLDQQTTDLIAQHQERPDGQGFPKQLSADKLHPKIKYIHMALEIQKMTSLSNGIEKLSLQKALDQIEDRILNNASYLDLTLLKKVKSFMGSD